MKWQDLIKSPEYYSHNMGENEMKKIVAQLAAVANKRLKRLEAKGLRFSSGKKAYEGPDSISGVKRFSVAKKNQGQLISEYKRVEGFLSSEKSTITGRLKTFFDTRAEYNRKRGYDKPKMKDVREEYYDLVEKDLDPVATLSALFEAMREGQWLSKGPKWPRNFDSKQTKEYFEQQIAENTHLSTEELIRKIKKDLGIDEDIEEQDNEDGVSTSKYF